MLGAESHEKLTALSQSSKLKNKQIVGFLIDLAVKYQFLTPGWEDRLNEALESVDDNRYSPLDDRCPALANTEKDGFVCCRNAPQQKKLGNGEVKDMAQVCGACVRVKGILEEIDYLREQVRKGTKLKLPQCNAGGILQSDGARFWCGRQYGNGYMTSEQCERRGCNALKWTYLDIKGELPKMDKLK